jgi:hypothetical protein
METYLIVLFWFENSATVLMDIAQPLLFDSVENCLMAKDLTIKWIADQNLNLPHVVSCLPEDYFLEGAGVLEAIEELDSKLESF